MNTMTKMDNNMTAIISLIMIGLGFLNGMIVATLLDKYEIEKINRRLMKVLDAKFETEQQLDDVREELEKERHEKDQILTRMISIIRQNMRLPPPEGPLTRSQAISDTDSDDDDFPNPASPDPVVNSTG